MTPPPFTLTAQADRAQPLQLDLTAERPADDAAVIKDAAEMLRTAANHLDHMRQCPDLGTARARKFHSSALANIAAALARIDQ